MAPFKLKFFKSSKSRDGQNSRGSSLETDDSGAMDGGLGSSESVVCPGTVALMNSDHDAGLGSSESMCGAGTVSQLMNAADAGSLVSAKSDSTVLASSPPPSYERVLEEVRELKTKLAKSLKDEELAIAESTADGRSVRKKASSSKKNNPEIMDYKSSKEFYKAMAKEWGITCKMSDNCRCIDCQSGYFDYPEKSRWMNPDYDRYQEQSDGGIGASTPMFVNEVMHGSACRLL